MKSTWPLKRLLACLLAASLSAGVVQAHGDHEPLPTSGVTVVGERLLVSAAARQAIDLTTAKVTLADLAEQVTLAATTEAPCHQHAVAATLAQGRIVEVLAQPGQPVERGQTLARFESLELERLQSELLSAAATFDLSDKLLTERERSAGALPGKVLQQSRADRAQRAVELGIAWQKLLALGATAEQLQQLRSAGQLIASLPILSPIAGKVSAVSVRPGQIVEPNQPLFNIVDAREVWVMAQVLEAQAAKVAAGTPMQAEFGGQTFSGKAEAVGVRLDPVRRTLPVWFAVASDGKLRPGMAGQVQLPVTRVAEAVVVPQRALRREGKNWFALVEESPGEFLRRRVEIGLRTGGQAEVLDGLFPGDQVVTTGLQELATLFGRDDEDASQSGSSPPIETLVSRPEGSSVLAALAEIETPNDQKTFIAPAFAGRLSNLLVERGQFIRAGTLMAEVESLELTSLVLDTLRAKAELAAANTAVERTAAPNIQAALPGQELWQMRSRLAQAQATVKSNQERLRLAAFNPEELVSFDKLDPASMQGDKPVVPRLPLRAPADGWLADFELSVGQHVAPQQQLFELHDRNTLWVRADLFQEELGRVRVGDQARVFFSADAGLQVEGQVARVTPVLVETGRTGSAWIEINNPGERLREGMLARALIFVDQPRSELAVDKL
jgi:cobalt-zinc-cadmium efflux system membrane fusion protein